MTRARLRWAFLGVALALAVPASLLVRRALASVALEGEAQQRAVAERVFDEMERALSDLLRAEEARPVADYAFARGAAPPPLAASDAPAPLGYFRIDGAGAVHPARGAARIAELAALAAQEGVRRDEIAVRAPAAKRVRAASDRATASPPTARAARSPAPQKDEKDAAGAPTPAPAADALEAIAKLNTGSKEREQREQKVYVAQQSAPPSAGRSAPLAAAEPVLVASESADVAPPPEANAADDASARAEAERAVAGALAAPLAPAPSAGALEEAPRAPEAAAELRPRAALQDAATLAPAPKSQLVRVVVDPLRGWLAPSGELVLLRTVQIGESVEREGLVLERAELERWLAKRALGGGALPRASVRLRLPAELGASSASAVRVVSRHRFAEPFDAWGAELSFSPFANPGARDVVSLAAALALVGGLGLFAVYRTSGVALDFAQRRNNFVAAVSHELKTPLTAIRLYAEMLRDGMVGSEEQRREYYSTIGAESERLSRLINNVLELSRLERGARPLEVRVGDLCPCVREALTLLAPHAQAHGLELTLELEEGIPPVRYERDALLQILFNLVDNAVKYGRGAPARIEISCRRSAEGVELAVRDHGPGVPREELGRILEPFYRRGDELTRSAPGAGIGLALVKTLAQQMGATLRVGAADGGGFVARVTLATTASAMSAGSAPRRG